MTAPVDLKALERVKAATEAGREWNELVAALRIAVEALRFAEHHPDSRWRSADALAQIAERVKVEK